MEVRRDMVFYRLRVLGIVWLDVYFRKINFSYSVRNSLGRGKKRYRG